MAPAPAVTILHLSDLHFGRKHRFEQEGLGSLLSRVTQDLDERAARDGVRPDLVVLSGDFAEYGKREEFDQASVFARELRAHLQLPPRRFVIVPGNHDVNWNKSRAYFEDREGDGLPIEEPYFPKLSHYKRFFDAFYGGETGIAFTEEEPWSLFAMDDLGVVVAGLDSAFAESHRPDDHHAFLGERQIRAFAGKLKPYKERGFLRVGVMHHDPFDKRGAAKAHQDQADFRRWLVPEINLLLHGDIHEETSRPLARDVPALGVGSAAVGVDERGPDVSNEYQMLVVRADGVERYLRAWVSDQKRWVASPRADAAGESGKTFIRADFDAVAALGRREVPAPVVDLAAIVAQYRAATARKQGAPTVFDLLGVGESDESGGLDFLRLFIPQDAVRDVARPERFARERWEGAPGEEGEREVPPSMLDWQMERTRSVQELFDQPRLFFIGAPGAGKSALTRWLLLKLCVPGERVEGLPDDLVPVRVELRTFEQEHRRAGAGYTVFDHVARVEADLHGPLTGDRLRALAEQGRVMWLFDGLDEVAEPSRRREMAARITGLLDLYKKCRAVVTSRAAGAEVARPILEGAGFQTYALQDFTTEQRDRFLGAWHDLVFRRDPATGAQRRNRMTAAIEAASSLQELCKSPLLCSMLAYLHREESLPRRRHLLYQKVLERMAEHWDANKGLPPRPAAEQFELEDKLAFLRALAWQMQSDPRTAGNAIGRSELEDFTAGFCERRWGQPRDAARRRAEVLIQQLYARNGVLSFLGADTYGFAHRAFLEHLAAAEAAERFRGRQWEIEDLGKVFVAHWREAGWEETLLLLCGQLQEDGEAGCARVVRLLQMIGEGRAAEIYGELNDYLVFCIKALGELSQLERGVPGDFARAINEALIVEMIDHGSVGFGKLNPAFRRCGGRWPEVRALAATILESDQRKKAPPFRLGSYGVWIAAGGKALRAELLSGALGRREIPPYLLCQEAAHFGAWSDQEVSTILDACQDRGERDQFHVAAAMALTAAAEWCENDRPINLLLNLAKQAVAEDLRIQSAGILLKVRLHVDVAKEILIEASKTGSPIARHATLCLLEGFADLVVQSLAAFAEAYGYALAELVKLARDLESAKEYLPKVLAAIRAAGDSEVLLGAALATLQCGLPCFEESEILERWRRIKDRERRCASIEPFRFIKGGERLAVKGWMDLLDGGLEVASEIARQCVDLRPETAGPMLLVLWRRLLDLDRNVAFLPLVRHILEIAPDRELEGRARQIRDDLLQGSMPEDTRMHAARSFQRIYPPAHAVLEELSDTAQHEWIRWTAARLTGNLASLNDLARRTKSDQLRGNIRHTLDLYGEINSLLQVGKLRRARVRFDGRDAGILEELTKVGNGTRFLYNAAYDGPPIAPNMPLGQEYKDTEALLPFFANLLPEGALYEQTARRLGLKRNDRLGVLLRVGGDTMGAIEILPMEPA